MPHHGRSALNLPCGGALEDDFAGFAVTYFDGVDQALVHLRANYDAVHQDEKRLGEIDLEQRFRRGEFEQAAGLIEAVEALLAQFEKMVAQRLRARVLAHREEGIPAGALRQLEQAGGGFIHGIATHAAAASGAKRLAHAGVQQAKKIEALG